MGCETKAQLVRASAREETFPRVLSHLPYHNLHPSKSEINQLLIGHYFNVLLTERSSEISRLIRDRNETKPTLSQITIDSHFRNFVQTFSKFIQSALSTAELS